MRVRVCLPCSHCNDCRELDLCRDEALQQGSWDCPNCGAGYDKAAVESRLVAALQARLKEFVLQDLHCTKCKQVRTLPLLLPRFLALRPHVHRCIG